MPDLQPHTPEPCDHHWISYMQPSIGLSWIRQCSQCREFDADDLQEQISAAEQRGAARAWVEGVLYAHERHNNHAGLSPSWKFGNPYRTDQEGDNE